MEMPIGEEASSGWGARCRWSEGCSVGGCLVGARSGFGWGGGRYLEWLVLCVTIRGLHDLVCKAVGMRLQFGAS